VQTLQAPRELVERAYLEPDVAVRAQLALEEAERQDTDEQDAEDPDGLGADGLGGSGLGREDPEGDSPTSDGPVWPPEPGDD